MQVQQRPDGGSGDQSHAVQAAAEQAVPAHPESRPELGTENKCQRVVDKDFFKERIQERIEIPEVRVRSAEKLLRLRLALAEVAHRLVVTLVRLSCVRGQGDIPFQCADFLHADFQAAAGHAGFLAECLQRLERG